jgi:peptidyl-prolyl cis-trans isomerase A (cyclophilin A)
MRRSSTVNKSATKSKIACLIFAALLAGLFATTALAQDQAQPVQPVQPVQPSAKPKASGTPSQGATTKKAPTAAARSYDRALLHPALLKDKAPEQYKVTFSTTRGDFVVTVTRAWAPLGADRFYSLVKHHFYDNASFFRVLPGFVVQFGLSAYPPVSTAWKNAVIKDDPVSQSNLRGYLVFATAGANTRTTQVFINLVDNKRLDSMGFAPFGQVTEGMNTVEMMYEGYGEGAPEGSGPNQDEIEKQGKPYLDKGWPKLDYIKTATIVAPEPAAAGKPAATAKPAPATKNPQ